jgi:hypothetical protein
VPKPAVVASHDHYDHYDHYAFAAYSDKDVPFIVKRGMGYKARRAGFTNVTEAGPWEQVTIGGLQITAAPARHGVPEITFVIQGAGKTIFFGADTQRIPGLDEVPLRFPDIDLALLPINGLQIRPAFNRQVVMNAEQAGDGGRGRRTHPTTVEAHQSRRRGPRRSGNRVCRRELTVSGCRKAVGGPVPVRQEPQSLLAFPAESCWTPVSPPRENYWREIRRFARGGGLCRRDRAWPGFLRFQRRVRALSGQMPTFG